MNIVLSLPAKNNNNSKRYSQRYRTTSFPTAGLEKYESVLYKIATNFDFEDNEVYDLMRQVRLYINNNSLKSRSISLKIWCSKIMVHKCIFMISQKLFSQHTFQVKPRVLRYSSNFGSSPCTDIRELSLSFHTIYILKQILDFSENEIAYILNTTPISVKEKFKEAASCLNKR